MDTKNISKSDKNKINKNTKVFSPPNKSVKDGDKLEVVVSIKDGDKTKMLNFRTSKKWMKDISESDGKKFGNSVLIGKMDEVLETDWEGVDMLESILINTITSYIGNTKTWKVNDMLGKTEGNLVFNMNIDKLKVGTRIGICYILPSEEVVV